MAVRRPLGREVLVQGYLRKAPLEIKERSNRGFLNLLCTSCQITYEQRWERRFCVLYKMRTPIETQIFFEYFKNKSDKHPAGQVDLNACDQIFEKSAIGKWPNIFVVNTTYLGRRRDYHFSAETPEEKQNWIDQLTAVLRMVPDQARGTQIKDQIGSRSFHNNPAVPKPTNIFTDTSFFSQRSDGPWIFNATSNLERSSHPVAPATEDYTMSFDDHYNETGGGDDEDDDDDCYRYLPQQTHAYVNIGEGVSDCIVDPDPPPPSPHHPDLGSTPGDNDDDDDEGNRVPSRCSSIYLNVWDSSTTDDKVTQSQLHSQNIIATTAESVPDTAVQFSTHRLKSPLPMSTSPSLPVRSRNSRSSSSSSEGEEDETLDEKSAPLHSAGEAEAPIEDSDELLRLPACITDAHAKEPKDAPSVMAGANRDDSTIQYIDAKNLEFSPSLQGYNGPKAAPSVPPKPLHFRKVVPLTPANVESSGGCSSSDQMDYKELDARGTHALRVLTAEVFGKVKDSQ